MKDEGIKKENECWNMKGERKLNEKKKTVTAITRGRNKYTLFSWFSFHFIAEILIYISKSARHKNSKGIKNDYKNAAQF